MSEAIATEQAESALEQVLRVELAHGDREIASARPILRQLVASDDHSLFNDEVIARTRGMILHCVRQMLHAVAKEAGEGSAEPLDHTGFVSHHADLLAARLFEDGDFLVHAHSLVIEARLAERLQRRSGIDPVLSPLMQELAASPDPAQAALAMNVIAAQARFIQQQRRMELPLGELREELFDKAMLVLHDSGIVSPDVLGAAMVNLRQARVPAQSRIEQMSQLVIGLDHRAMRALALDHAGLAIFINALAMASQQDREMTIMALSDNQFARFALSLRSAGLGQTEVEKQFVFLHPELELPPGFHMLNTDQASRMLIVANAGIES